MAKREPYPIQLLFEHVADLLAKNCATLAIEDVRKIIKWGDKPSCDEYFPYVPNARIYSDLPGTLLDLAEFYERSFASEFMAVEISQAALVHSVGTDQARAVNIIIRNLKDDTWINQSLEAATVAVKAAGSESRDLIKGIERILKNSDAAAKEELQQDTLSVLVIEALTAANERAPCGSDLSLRCIKATLKHFDTAAAYAPEKAFAAIKAARSKVKFFDDTIQQSVEEKYKFLQVLEINPRDSIIAFRGTLQSLSVAPK